MKRIVTLLVFLLVTALVNACGSSYGTPQDKGPINVSSKADIEGPLLGQMISQMLAANGFQVVEKPAITGTQVIRQAIMSGEIDIYPEYTGNGAFFFGPADSPVWQDARKGWEEVKKLDKEKNNIVWLQPAPANNTWAIAITKTLADKEKLVSMVDFAAYVNRGGTVKLVGSEEFFTSEAALPAFQKAYGFSLKPEQRISLAGGKTSQSEKAASEGTSGANAAMAYGTDGELSAFNLVVLTDPKAAQPVYEPAPIVRGEVMAKYPEIAGIIDPVFKSLDLVTLQGLNAKIAVEGQNPKDVARNYLVSKNFLKQ